MEENTEKQEVEQVEEVKETEVKEDRPEINYQAELARKNARIAELEAKELAKEESKPRYDNNSPDITNWDDNSLKLLRNSKDPSHAQYLEKAEDLILERKFKAMQSREYEARRKEETARKLQDEYPEAMDSSSEFARKVAKVMQEHDLDRTPSGKLLAARIVAAESKTSQSTKDKKEEDRVTRVKGQMVDGDRPKSTDVHKDSETKQKELKDSLMDTKHEARQVDAVSQILKERGMSQKEFFKK